MSWTPSYDEFSCTSGLPTINLKVIRPATPRAKLRFRTAHPGGFLCFCAPFGLFGLGQAART
jgi:hypothetical protein